MLRSTKVARSRAVATLKPLSLARRGMVTTVDLMHVTDGLLAAAPGPASCATDVSSWRDVQCCAQTTVGNAARQLAQRRPAILSQPSRKQAAESKSMAHLFKSQKRAIWT